MGTKNNPGAFDCHAAAHPDEPLFTLLGRDPLGASLVTLWALARDVLADQRPDPGREREKVAEAMTCVDAMKQWLYSLRRVEVNVLDVLPWACSACGSTNPIKRAKGLCRKCYETKYRTDRIAREPGWRAKESRERYLQNREQSIERTTQQRRALKREVLSQLGGLCACCGETRIEFLTLDHINNDGAEHRRLLTGKSRASSTPGLPARSVPRALLQLQLLARNVGLLPAPARA